MAIDVWGIVAVVCAGMAAIISLCCLGIYGIARLLIRDFTNTQDDKKLGGILTALLRDAGGLAALSQEVPVEDMKNQPEPNNPYTQGGAQDVDPSKLARSIKAIIKGPGLGSSQFMELDANDPLKFGYDSPARQQLMNYLKPYTRKVFAIVGLIVTMIVIGMLATLASVVGYSVLSVKL